MLVCGGEGGAGLCSSRGEGGAGLCSSLGEGGAGLCSGLGEGGGFESDDGISGTDRGTSGLPGTGGGSAGFPKTRGGASGFSEIGGGTWGLPAKGGGTGDFPETGGGTGDFPAPGGEFSVDEGFGDLEGMDGFFEMAGGDPLPPSDILWLEEDLGIGLGAGLGASLGAWSPPGLVWEGGDRGDMPPSLLSPFTCDGFGLGVGGGLGLATTGGGCFLSPSTPSCISLLFLTHSGTGSSLTLPQRSNLSNSPPSELIDPLSAFSLLLLSHSGTSSSTIFFFSKLSKSTFFLPFAIICICFMSMPPELLVGAGEGFFEKDLDLPEWSCDVPEGPEDNFVLSLREGGGGGRLVLDSIIG